MKHVMLFGLLLAFACGVNARPYYSYDLYGTVTGNAVAANSLADVNVGDEFLIRLNIGGKDSGEHKISFQGVIGGWDIFEQQTNGYYHWGDWSPERFYTTGSHSPLNAPDGNGSTVYPNDIYLTLLGMEQTGTVIIPEDDRLVRDTGELNLNQFRSGGFHFWFFNQGDGSTTSTEEDLYGSITRIMRVPEPGTLLLSALGLVFLLINRQLRYPR
ncbi:PEP-CTERM sorting domain-containing protein [Marinobacter sp. SS13-12]|uniref:PEP-CTERM sorting domain-containing protein n=1 Tax=Marinobacter sp. SS13-12 TaxID=3050451 RepID=UPI0025550680|nr:PEP-CTERM sorting domain-containing protein [Marinobacter sp. SS13-12]MDK8464276.1 PEP-CTERM sorting domain-containing protein [Marinobacter sp. SS13-12]